jgi:hypothetical protein
MATSTRSIPPLAADRPPLKVNVYELAQNSATTLAPLFPYRDAGSIVPCLSVFRGGPGRRYRRFQHFNTVDEVVLMFTAPAGLVSVGPKLHPVGAPFDDAEDPESMAVAVITQRQLLGGRHTEEYRFLCEQCGRRLFVERFDATPPPRNGFTDSRQPFATVVEGCCAAERFNADEEVRRCKGCGHQNDAFPVRDWGWDAYTGQSRVAARADADMRAARAAQSATSSAR